jgi:hypothetical protein
MAILSGFFKSINQDRRYNAEFFANFFGSLVGNGVFANPSTNLQVISSSGTQINVQSGKGWINGYYIVNTSNFSLTLATADGVLNRIDRIVMQWNSDTREITITNKQGTYAVNPTAPTLTRNSNIYELALADIRINAGTVNINQSMITDTRLNTQLCGIVTSLVQQVDTTTLFNQYNEALLDVIDTSQQRFDDFLTSIENILDENVAATLNNRLVYVENGLNNTNQNLQNVVNSKGQPNGIASLGADGLLIASQSRASTLRSVVYSNPGNYTWTVPPGVSQVLVSGCGAGGGGAGDPFYSGSTGGFTSFGTLLTLNGGGGGGISQLGGISGGFGGSRGARGLSNFPGLGFGGSGFFGSGGTCLAETYTASSNDYTTLPGFGAGGGGGFRSNTVPYGGGAGACAIDTPINVTPGQVISITVGQGGGVRASNDYGAKPGGNGLLIIKYAQ